MNAALKSKLHDVRISNWPAMVWLVLVVGGLYVAGTVAVGVELYAATERPMVINTR